MENKLFSKALDKAEKRLRDKNHFKYKTIIIRGEKYEPFIPEDRMLKIPQFKGTGEKRKFLDLVKEVEQLWVDEFTRVLTNLELDFDAKNAPCLDEYIIQNNFQVVYEQGDVIVKSERCI